MVSLEIQIHFNELFKIPHVVETIFIEKNKILLISSKSFIYFSLDLAQDFFIKISSNSGIVWVSHFSQTLCEVFSIFPN